MKVLHSYKIYRPDADGGIPFVIATLSRAEPDGIENHVLVARNQGRGRTLAVGGASVEAVASLGTVFSTPLAPTFPARLLKRAQQTDVVVHHAPFPLADLVLSRLPLDVALIVYWHADIVGYPILKLPFKASIIRTLQRADRVIVADRSTLESSDLLPAFADKCAIVPYGADTAYWSTCTVEEAARAAALRDQFPRMIIAIGRLVPYKGFNVLLEALQSFDAHLIIIGEGPLLSELKAIANRLGVSDRVSFEGRIPISDVKAHLHAARVFAFPSVTAAEAFGIVQLEAMAVGLPIVNTSLPTAVPEIARHSQEALTVAPNNPQELAAALRLILDDPNLAKRLGDAARERAETHYDEKSYVQRIKAIYRDVLTEKATLKRT